MLKRTGQSLLAACIGLLLASAAQAAVLVSRFLTGWSGRLLNIKSYAFTIGSIGSYQAGPVKLWHDIKIQNHH